jgi:site-specific recombinase XerD
MMKVRRSNLTWVDLEMSQLDLTKLISHYAQSNKADNKSAKTVTWYSEMLECYVKFIRATNREPILTELNVETVREFILHEQSRSLSPFTVQGKVRALRAFSSWLWNEGYTPDNMLARIKVPKAPQVIIEPLKGWEIDALLKTQNPLTALGSRNIALLMTYLDTGPRLSEVCNAYFDDLHLEEGYLKVLGKGNKERIVPIGASTQKVLWRYVIHFRPEPLGELNNYLFLTSDGKRLQPNAVKLLFRRWGRNAGVPRLHAHLLRHTYATNFLLHRCGDVYRLKQILGHNTLQMVDRYVHYASAEDAIRRHASSPVDQMGIKGLRSYNLDRKLKNTKH